MRHPRNEYFASNSQDRSMRTAGNMTGRDSASSKTARAISFNEEISSISVPQ